MSSTARRTHGKSRPPCWPRRRGSNVNRLPWEPEAADRARGQLIMPTTWSFVPRPFWPSCRLTLTSHRLRGPFSRALALPARPHLVTTRALPTTTASSQGKSISAATLSARDIFPLTPHWPASLLLSSFWLPRDSWRHRRRRLSALYLQVARPLIAASALATSVKVGRGGGREDLGRIEVREPAGQNLF
jgi:hypothetical protein